MIAERVEYLIEIFKISQADFSKKTNLSQQYLSNLKERNGGMNSPYLEKLLRAYPKLNARWLITGEGEMWTEPPDEVQVTVNMNTGRVLKDGNFEYKNGVEAMEKELMAAKTEVELLRKLLAIYEAKA